MARKKKQTYNKEPNNYSFWLITLSRPFELQEFLDRGNKRQRTEIIRAWLHLKKNDLRLFERYNGTEWVNKFMNTNKGEPQC